MAGIFVNVNDDIQNLRALKTEIENVKRALKGIDVKVDLNIKDGLESQLQSLTSQYDALASKIAETEGKIRLSTERINESTQKIIDAQEKLIGATQGQGSTQQQTAATATETASVQAQSKAYADLRDEIDSILGSRSENIRKMVEEQNAIRLINAELKEMEKSTKGGNYSPEQLKRIEQLNDSLLTHKTALAEVRQALNNNSKMESAAVGSMKQLSQELGRMRMAYRELSEEERKSPFGQELLKSINDVDARIKEFDASIGNYQRNVGNYASGFNGLNMSVQQIVRELPSAAMGLNTFFLAISNNLPILVDEINRAKKANAEMVANNQKAIPVWKQVASSLLSWQTALMVGISVLSIYGKDIINWVGNLFKGKDAAISLKEAQEKLNEAFKSDTGNLGQQIALVSSLSIKWRELGGDIEAQKKFIEENKTKFDELGVAVSNVKEAENLLVDNTDSFIEALTKRAQAAAGMKLAEEQYAEAVKLRVEAEKMPDKVKQTRRRSGRGNSTYYVWVDNEEKKSLLEQAEAAEKLAESFVKVTHAKEDEAEQTLKNANITPNDNKNNKENQSIKQVKDIEDLRLSILRENQQKEIDLMEEGEEKRLKQLDLNYQLELDKIRKWRKQLLEAQGGKLTDDQEAMLGMAVVLAEDKRNAGAEDKEYTKLLEKYRGYFEQRKAIEDKYNEDRKKLQERGASQEALDENEYQKTKALAEVDAMFASREEEFQIWADQVVGISLEKLEELLVQAKQELEKMESENPTNPKLAQARAKVNALEKNITKARGQKKDEDPSPKASEKWKDLYNTLRKVENQFEEIGDAIGGTVGEIISTAGAVTSSTITMVEGIVRLTDGSISAIQGTSEASTKALQTVEKASVILAVVGAALQIATKIANMFGADYSDYNKAKENYESYVDVLDKVIDKQKELTETMTGKDAVEASERAIELIEKQAEAARELGKMRLNAGASLGSHSIGVRTKKNMTQEGWDEALGALGAAQYNKIREGRMEGLFDLSVTQLEKLQKEAPLFWAQLDGDVRDYLEQILETNEGLEDMKGTLQETLTGLTFEDFSSDVLESLYDVEKGAKDIFDDMSDYMRKAMIKAMYVKNYEPEMQKWYEQWAKAMEDGVMTTQEKTSLDSLKESIITGATEAAKDINAMFENTSYYEQEASAKGFETMTQDQAGELNGRFAASQVILEESRTQLTLMNVTMNELKAVGLNIQDVTSSIQDLIANSYIELLVISENTGETVKCLKVIQNDIAQVKENTKNL